ncbi:sulfite exporter TauE/SafE family protein [Sandaracinobacteroides hominis]|uniref:sulfite exporter TauE/SafE family protein n=1 Tax=Sandaracinobacteroides hominis TaxID=2780086 RepID=UPI0018F3BF46|nr:TSUP family transporter [Sandaracinobacteroides hominis]
MIEASAALLLAAGLWAGAQNALAGGGSFVTIPALMAAGLDARVANLTSTVAVFPGQITTALANRRLVSGIGPFSFLILLGISLVGGVLGALLLLATPTDLFSRMLPWLVLVATLLFARGAFGKKLGDAHLKPLPFGLGQFGVAIYGGYFGGGIGFLMLALFTLAGAAVKEAQANKNALASAMNFSGALVFILSGEVDWSHALPLCVGTVIGGYAGARLIAYVPDKALKLLVVLIGLALFAGLLWRG